MYIGDGGNCYLHLRISKIKDIGLSTGESIISLECSTKNRQRGGNRTKDDNRVFSGVVDIWVDGYLREYVVNELEEGNNIFVIASPEARQTLYNGVPMRKVKFRAECIYREDFLKYFPNEWRTT